jgi:hypothetical protein
MPRRVVVVAIAAQAVETLAVAVVVAVETVLPFGVRAAGRLQDDEE